MATNIFEKIFQIMEHYESILEKITYTGAKYKPDKTFQNFMDADEFFSSILKNVPVHKNEAPQKTEYNPDEPNPLPEEEPQAEPENTRSPEQIIKNYIKKCYKIIVLKCHPDKNNMHEDAATKFIRCQDYYDNQFLIGILYIFYIYKINPPYPLNSSTPIVHEDDYTIILDRIICEIRVIQDKLVQLNSPLPEDTADNGENAQCV
jgi:hypothetical protein